MGRVVACDLLAPAAVIAGRLELSRDARHHVVLDGHAVMRDVAIGDAVEIQPADVERIQAESSRDVVQHALDDHHALRRAETAERRVGDGIRLAAVRDHLEVLEEVGVVDVAQRPVVHGRRQVQRVAAARRHGEREREDAAPGVEADVVVGEEFVALAGDDHVVVAIEAQLDGPAAAHGGDGRGACQERGLAFLAAETPAHAAAMDADLVRVAPEGVRHEVLHLAGMLRRAHHEHAAIFLRQGDRDLALEVEVVLAAQLEHALQALRRARQAWQRLAAHDRVRGRDEARRGDRLADPEDGGERLVIDAGLARGAPRRVVRVGHDQEDRLAGVLHQAVGEDRVVVDHRGAVVLAGDVARREDREDSGRRGDVRKVQRAQPRVRDAAGAEGAVQRIGGERDVVGVTRLAAHVQVRALVDRRATGGAHGETVGTTSSTRIGLASRPGACALKKRSSSAAATRLR